MTSDIIEMLSNFSFSTCLTYSLKIVLTVILAGNPNSNFLCVISSISLTRTYLSSSGISIRNFQASESSNNDSDNLVRLAERLDSSSLEDVERSSSTDSKKD